MDYRLKGFRHRNRHGYRNRVKRKERGTKAQDDLKRKDVKYIVAGSCLVIVIE